MPPSTPVPFDPDWVVPTSMMLREWLDSTGLSPRVAAARVPADQRDAATTLLLGVLDGAPVTEDTARLLFVVTDISAAFWLAFERNYRAGLAAGKTVVADSESDDPAHERQFGQASADEYRALAEAALRLHCEANHDLRPESDLNGDDLRAWHRKDHTIIKTHDESDQS